MKRMMFGLILFFVSANSFAQNAQFASVASNVSFDVVDDFRDFLVQQSAEILIDISGDQTDFRALLKDVTALFDLFIRLDNKSELTIGDLEFSEKAKLIFLINEVRGIAHALKTEGNTRVLQFDGFRHVRTSTVSDGFGGTIQVYELTDANLNKVKISKILEPEYQQQILTLRETLRKMAILQFSSEKSEANFYTAFRHQIRVSLVKSLFKNISKLNDDQQIRFFEDLLYVDGELKDELYFELREKLEQIELRDLNVNQVYEKLENIVKWEAANLIELMKLPIVIAGVRRGKSPWKNDMQTKVDQFLNGSRGELTQAARIHLVLELAAKIK